MKRNDIVTNTETIRTDRGWIAAGTKFYVTVTTDTTATVRVLDRPSSVWDDVPLSILKLV